MRNRASVSGRWWRKGLKRCLPDNKNELGIGFKKTSYASLVLTWSAGERLQIQERPFQGMLKISWWIKQFCLFFIKSSVLFSSSPLAKLSLLLAWTKSSIRDLSCLIQALPQGCVAESHCFLTQFPEWPAEFPNWKNPQLQQRSCSSKQFSSFGYLHRYLPGLAVRYTQRGRK